jgi:hypothetical protein
MNDNPAANGGIGSVGIWNFGAEENTYDTVYVHANIPLLATAHNPTVNFRSITPTSYQTLARTHSVGVNTFTGECFLAALNKRAPSIVTEDVNSLKFENTYLGSMTSKDGTIGTNQSAWKVFGVLQGLDYNGLIEGHARALEVTGAVTGARMRVTFGGIDSGSTERVLLNRGGQGRLINCEFLLQDSVAPTRPLLASTPSAPDERISCYIQNSMFRVNCDKRYTTIQENVLWNPNTGNVAIEAVHNSSNPYRYEIDAVGKQKVAIPLTTVWVNGGIKSAEVVRFVMPTIIGSGNALSAEVTLKGILTILGSGTNAKVTKYFEAVLGISVSNTGTIALSNSGTADAIAEGATAVVNSAGNNITAATVTGVDRITYVQIVVTPTRSGSNNESVQFIGEAEMHWSGNESRAPSLQTLS